MRIQDFLLLKSHTQFISCIRHTYIFKVEKKNRSFFWGKKVDFKPDVHQTWKKVSFLVFLKVEFNNGT